VSAGDCFGSNELNQFGFVYHTEKKQYDKTLAWYILAARKNNSRAQNNIGELYHYGLAVPKNYLCALKWYLKTVERNYDGSTPNNIGRIIQKWLWHTA
jgi:TPR repeat protein